MLKCLVMAFAAIACFAFAAPASAKSYQETLIGMTINDVHFASKAEADRASQKLIKGDVVVLPTESGTARFIVGQNRGTPYRWWRSIRRNERHQAAPLAALRHSLGLTYVASTHKSTVVIYGIPPSRSTHLVVNMPRPLITQPLRISTKVRSMTAPAPAPKAVAPSLPTSSPPANTHASVFAPILKSVQYVNLDRALILLITYVCALSGLALVFASLLRMAWDRLSPQEEASLADAIVFAHRIPAPASASGPGHLRAPRGVEDAPPQRASG